MCAKAEDGTHTLMKGDEVVEALEEGAYFVLLGRCWNRQLEIKKILVIEPLDGTTLKRSPIMPVKDGCQELVIQDLIMLKPDYVRILIICLFTCVLDNSSNTSRSRYQKCAWLGIRVESPVFLKQRA